MGEPLWTSTTSIIRFLGAQCGFRRGFALDEVPTKFPFSWVSAAISEVMSVTIARSFTGLVRIRGSPKAPFGSSRRMMQQPAAGLLGYLADVAGALQPFQRVLCGHFEPADQRLRTTAKISQPSFSSSTKPSSLVT